MAEPTGDAPLVSAVMIVRDEEEKLGRCLASLTELVDEVVVVDTGSIDETVAIAEAHGCRVAHFPWIDDFAAARNRSLELARGRWVLMVDADEVAVADGRAALEEATSSQPEALGLSVWWRARPGLTPMRELRMWRNRPDVRFRGRIHEHVVADLFGLVGSGAGTLGTVELLLEHDGYEGDQTRKHQRDLALLEVEISEGEERPYLRGCQGSILMAAGRTEEGLRAWRRGADMARDQPNLRRPQDCGCHQDLIMYGLAQGQDVTDLVDEAWRLFDYCVIAWAKLVHGEVTGDDDSVVEAATRLLAGPLPQDEGFAVDPQIFDRWPLVARGRALLRLGRPAEAAADLRTAEEVAPGVQEYRVLRQMAESMVGALPCS